MKRILFLLTAVAIAAPNATIANIWKVAPPETVTVSSGPLRLWAILYRPQGRGPFPGVLFNHGSGHASGVDLNGLHDQRHPEVIGPVFARHGYTFLHLYRRGDGLSAGQGVACGDVMDSAFTAGGQEARDLVQVQLLEQGDLSDSFAGLAFLRSLPEVDRRRLAVVGHSFGGSLTVLMAARDSSLRAAIAFSGAGHSWLRSAPLRSLLISAVRGTSVPIEFIHARNDFSTASGDSLAAEMERLRKAHRLRIYRAFGRTPEEGHWLIYLAVPAWESDVFAFLNPLMRR